MGAVTRSCPLCGAPCYGKVCRECFESEKYKNPSRARSNKRNQRRYRERQH